MLQAPAGLLEATLQLRLRAAFVGSGSVRLTFVRVLLPVFVAVMKKPIWLPADTDTASAVLVMVRPGTWTQMPSRSVFWVLPDVTVAVLSMLAVWPLMVTLQGAIAPPPPAGAEVGL